MDKKNEVQQSFTITRSNHKGLMEWLTCDGWRSENKITENNYEKLYFSRSEGTKEIKKLKSDCRFPAMKKSIILNYS